MNENNNSDASTNNSKTMNLATTHSQNALNEATDLLLSWQLPQLCRKFRDEEVCTIAFQHLTETDINELIPKIGPRAIFRARLAKWRQQPTLSKDTNPAETSNRNSAVAFDQREDTQLQSNATTTPQHSTAVDTFVEPTVIKLEPANVGEHWLLAVDDFQSSHEGESLHDTTPTHSTGAEPMDAQMPDLLAESNAEKLSEAQEPGDAVVAYSIDGGDLETRAPRRQIPRQFADSREEIVNIRDILKNSFDGNKALHYFATRKELDPNQRKRVVKAIITRIITKRLPMSSYNFQDMARQLVELFPTEREETYYVPRTGNTCPKGALYNKFLNMGKALRKHGLLEYRINRVNKLK